MRHRPAPLIAAVMSLAVGCGADAQEVVPADALLTHGWSIGVAFQSSIEFEQLNDAAFDGSNIWAVDRNRLLKFDEGGSLVAEIGREGSGPGEFQYAAQIHVDSLVHVFDPRLGRESVFGRDGSLVGTDLLSTSAVPASVAATGLDSGWRLYVTPSRFSAEPSHHDPLSRIVLWRNDAVDTVASYRAPVAMWAIEGAYGVTQTTAGRGGGWTVTASKEVVLVDGQTGEVVWRCPPRYDVCVRHRLGIEVQEFGLRRAEPWSTE